jgi:pSer/pThr/pTyr-binding forkhead associated (FHA) protein
MINDFGRDPIPGVQRLAPDTAYLLVRNGPQANRKIPLTQVRMAIGRNDPPHVRVDIDLSECELGDPPAVSRRHAILQWHEGTLQIRDLGSRNGTFIDGKKLEIPPNQSFSEPVSLKAGSHIRLGNLELEVINHESY